MISFYCCKLLLNPFESLVLRELGNENIKKTRVAKAKLIYGDMKLTSILCVIYIDACLCKKQL